MKKVELVPTAKVSVRKSVLKKYQVKDENVYFLKKDSEFEIELFNPTKNTIMCEIHHNGNTNNNEGLILYPGQRIFLERHIDTNKKLKFDTYLIDDSVEAKEAIVNNGLIEVYFYYELIPTGNYGTTITITPPYYTSPSVWRDYPICGTNSMFYCNSTLTTSNPIMTAASFDMDSIETGRIGKGDSSNQAFVSSYEQFNTCPFHIERFKILPDSTKLKTIDDFKHKKYCTECGAKVKETDKFCSKCGTKL